MSSKVLIFGASGKIGHTIYTELSKKDSYQVYGTYRNNNLNKVLPSNLRSNLVHISDVNDINHTNKILRDIKPDVVINAVGVIKQLKESSIISHALELNSLWPHRLYGLCINKNIRLIQISSDCVFDGIQGSYKELDIPNATDTYGKTKWLGELAGQNAVTLRTSTIGHEIFSKNGLIEWLFSGNNEIDGYTKAIFSGLPTIELARIISDYVIPNSDLRGLHHVASNKISKYKLLSMVVERYNDKKINIIPQDSVVIDRSLNASKFNNISRYAPPSWDVLIEKMYSHYKKSDWYRK